MVKYILTLTGIRDIKMCDGTTGCTMALAEQNIELMQILLSSKHECDIDHVHLVRKALKELAGQSSSSKFIEVLVTFLQRQGISQSTSEDTESR